MNDTKLIRCETITCGRIFRGIPTGFMNRCERCQAKAQEAQAKADAELEAEYLEQCRRDQEAA